MKRYYILLFVVFLSSLVYAVEITNFNTQSSEFNISFGGNENQTFDIILNKDANISSAYMNLSSETYLCYQESFNTTNQTGIDGSCSLNYSGSHSFNDGGNGVYHVNYTKPSNLNPNGNILRVKIGMPVLGDGEMNLSIPKHCLDAYPTKLNFKFDGILKDGSLNVYCFNSSGTHFLYNTTPSSSCSLATGYSYSLLDGNWASFSFWDTGSSSWKISSDTNKGCMSGAFYEEAIYWNVHTSNTNITINDSSIWNHTGIFNLSNNWTLDFSSILNTSLNNGLCDCVGCSLVGNNCSINFTFHSDSAGKLGISDLNITWLEYTNPNLTIINPNGTYSTIAGLPVNINTSDNWEISYCYYNVTRGASTEVSDTQITNFQSSSFDVSGDATYTINVFCNDTSGNVNYTSNSFIVDTSGGTGSPGGGSSSSTITVTSSGNWTMTTSSGTALYDLKMTKSSSRTSYLNFENFGTTLRDIEITCESADTSIDICKYVNFEKDLKLPVLKGIKTSVPIQLVLPDSIKNGEYKFNIYAEDEENNVNIVTFDVNVGNFGVFTNFLVKLFSSKDISGYFIPYFLILIFSALVGWILSFLIFKKTKFVGVISLIVAIIFGILSVMLL